MDEAAFTQQVPTRRGTNGLIEIRGVSTFEHMTPAPSPNVVTATHRGASLTGGARHPINNSMAVLHSNDLGDDMMAVAHSAPSGITGNPLNQNSNNRVLRLDSDIFLANSNSHDSVTRSASSGTYGPSPIAPTTSHTPHSSRVPRGQPPQQPPSPNLDVTNDYGFNTQLFDCAADVHSCCEGAFCICCLIGREYNMLQTGQPTTDYFCCTAMMLCTVCNVVPGLATACGSAYVRSIARDRLNLLNENECANVCKGFFCQSCSACQIYREMSIRRVWPGAGICYSHPFRREDAPGFGATAPTVQVMGSVVSSSSSPGGAGVVAARQQQSDARYANRGLVPTGSDRFGA